MQESARAVVATAERAAKLTRQLLAVSRKDKIVSHRVDFHACIESVVDLMQTTIDRRISIASSLLATETDVFGDSSSLSAAMLNLGINARDAITGKGKITFETKNVRLDQDFISGKGFNVEPGQYIEMKISDTGAGMTQDVKEHLYEPFYTTKELGQGTGLGLAAVYGTMMAHQGAISCESKLGHGTEFRLYLPLGKAPAVLAEEALDWEEEGSGRILVVDDERIIRETATATLEAIGYQVIVAHDGAEAIEIYRREGTRIDLVILDVVMPGITGPDTFYTLRSICPTVKVLFSSGYSFDADGQRLVNESKFGFIQKPYRRNELYAAVQKELPPSRPAEFASKLTGN